MLIALEPKKGQGVELSVGAMKMMNAILFMSQCAIAQSFGSRENFWRNYQKDANQELKVTMGAAELSYFMWGTRRRSCRGAFEQLANTLKDLVYVSDELRSSENAQVQSVFGYIDVPKEQGRVTVIFRPKQCEAYFHPKSLYSNIRLESMFSVRSLWTCFLLELGARHRLHSNKKTKGYSILEWYRRVTGVDEPKVRIDNVHRAVSLACKEIQKIQAQGLCDYTVRLITARQRLLGQDLVRFEVELRTREQLTSENKQVENSKVQLESSRELNTTSSFEPSKKQATDVDMEPETSTLALTLTELLHIKADVAREAIRKYGEPMVGGKLKELVGYLRDNPNSLRNPAGFFVRMLEGSVSLGDVQESVVNLNNLSNWVLRAERQALEVQQRQREQHQQKAHQDEQNQRLELLEQFKKLPEKEQQQIHMKTLESLKGNPPIANRVQENRYHVLVLGVYKEMLLAQPTQMCVSG